MSWTYKREGHTTSLELLKYSLPRRAGGIFIKIQLLFKFSPGHKILASNWPNKTIQFSLKPIKIEHFLKKN